MGRRVGTLAVAALLLILLIGGAAHAEILSCGPQGPNTVVNGAFTSNISSWTVPIGFGTTQWSLEDANGSPNSGSVLIVNYAPPSNQDLSISQCQALPGGVSYDLNARVAPVNFCCPSSSPLGGSGSGTREVEHTGFLYVLLNFYSKANCGGAPLNEFVRVDADGRNQWQTLGQTFKAPASAVSVRTTLGVFKSEASVDNTHDLRGNFDNISITPSSAVDTTKLCLGSRFRAQAQWTTSDGQSGAGQAVSLTSDTGYFWFFNPNNVEMIVKVLDGCGVNSRFWVFAGGLTNVRVVLQITDLVSGAVQTYENPQGTAFVPIQDTNGFAACAAASAAGNEIAVSRILPERTSGMGRPAAQKSSTRPPAVASAGCVPSTTTLCLNQGRFAATAQWTLASGATGPARVVSLTDETGYFWFFNPSNVEMVTKVLNGCGVSSSYWVFAAGLTDVGVLLTIKDTLTGAVRTYTNPQGIAFQPIQDTVAFATCN